MSNTKTLMLTDYIVHHTIDHDSSLYETMIACSLVSRWIRDTKAFVTIALEQHSLDDTDVNRYEVMRITCRRNDVFIHLRGNNENYIELYDYEGCVAKFNYFTRAGDKQFIITNEWVDDMYIEYFNFAFEPGVLYIDTEKYANLVDTIGRFIVPDYDPEE